MLLNWLNFKREVVKGAWLKKNSLKPQKWTQIGDGIIT